MITVERLAPVNLVLLIAGFILWSVAFSALYGALGVGCELGWQERAFGPVSLNTAVLAAILAGHLLLHAALVVWLWRRTYGARGHPPPSRFLAFTSLGTAICGMIATLWTGAPIAVLTQCAM